MGIGTFARRATIAAAVSLTATSTMAKDIVWARYGDIDSLDPRRATSTLSLQVWSLIYNTLLATDKDGKAVPNIAESWTANAEGTQYTFKLHDGIKCSDGTPLDANDVKYTVDQVFDKENPSITKASWGPIEKVEVVDPLTVRFDLSKPFVSLLPFLADAYSSIVCDSNKDQPGFGTTAAIGSGPWTFVSWTKGDRIVLKRNDNYVNFGKLGDNKGAPYMDGLVITVVPDPQARLAALKTGEVDIAEPPPDDVPAIQQSGELKLVVAERTGQNVFWEFAVHRPPFNDKRARLAVGYATDAATAVQLIYGDLSHEENCPVSGGNFGYDSAFCRKYRPNYDPAKAKELLGELGYGPDHPLETNMLVWTGGNREKLAEVFQSQLAEVGINAHIQMMDIGTMNARVKQENNTKTGIGSMDMMTWSWFDPDILYALWHSPGAYDGFTSPELDAMLEKTRTLTDPGERTEAVHQVFRYLLENGVHIPLYSPGWEWIFATRPQVSGLHVAPFLYPIFNDVKIAGE